MPGTAAEPSAIGTWRGDGLEIRQELDAHVRAGELNIITERYQPSGIYHLVVATNVLIYFNPKSWHWRSRISTRCYGPASGSYTTRTAASCSVTPTRSIYP